MGVDDCFGKQITYLGLTDCKSVSFLNFLLFGLNEINELISEYLSNPVKMFCVLKEFCGSGGGLVVSLLACYSKNLSLNLAEIYRFSVKFAFEKNENKQNEAGVGQHIK